jgi:hypothetical protein
LTAALQLHYINPKRKRGSRLPSLALRVGMVRDALVAAQSIDLAEAP